MAPRRGPPFLPRVEYEAWLRGLFPDLLSGRGRGRGALARWTVAASLLPDIRHLE